MKRFNAAIAVALGVLLSHANLFAQVTNINTGVGYATIAAAITAANPGDRIEVSPGTYAESLAIAKSITLFGYPGAILTGAGAGNGINITTAGYPYYQVVIDGLTITNFSVGINTSGSTFGHLSVLNCTIRTNISHGVQIGVNDKYASITIENTDILENGGSGINSTFGSSIGELAVKTSNVSSNSGMGVNLYELNIKTGMTFEDVFIRNNRSDGFMIWDDCEINNGLISGGAIENNAGFGWMAHGNASPLLLNISNLTFSGVLFNNNTAGDNLAFAGPGLVQHLTIENCYFGSSGWGGAIDFGENWYPNVTCSVVRVTGNTFNEFILVETNNASGRLGFVGADQLEIHNNKFLGGTGILQRNGTLVPATLNWWNHDSGPGGWGPGSGSTIANWSRGLDTVIYDPWLTHVAITAEPSDTTAAVGQAASFDVTATGNSAGTDAGVFYQWQKDGSDITGETNANLTIDPVALGDAGGYRCILGHAAGYVTSQVATLKVGPGVTTWPTASGITYGDTLADSTLSGGAADVPGTFAFTTPSTMPAAGNYAADVTFTPDDTMLYAPVAGTSIVAVAKKALTVTADDKTKVYGSADPAFTATYAGFIAGEGPEDLGGTLAFARTAGENVGAYAITPSGLTSANYAITFARGTLTITKKALTVTADDKTKVEGQPDPAFTVTYAGFIAGEGPANLGGTLTFTRAPGEAPGAYAITPSGLTSANYAITFVAGTLTITATPIPPVTPHVRNDYNGDGVSDLVVFDQNTGKWYIVGIDGTTIVAWDFGWGWPGAWPVPGDYDGDGIADCAVFDQNNGLWFVIKVNSTDILAWAFPWGWPGAWPVSGDYDGDGKADCAVFDQNTGNWFVIALNGTEPMGWAFAWGWPGAWPVSGDYDGDGKSDCAVFDQNTGNWFVIALNGTEPLAWAFPWGWPGAWPVPGDYDGDGKADCAVFDQNTGNWFVITLNGTEPLAWSIPWGWPGAWPVGTF